MRNLNVILVALTVALFQVGVAGAQVLTIAEDATNTSVVTDLTGYQTTGSDMAGKLQVTAFFPGGASETVPWLPTGVGSGAAVGTFWTLSESGDTFSSAGPTGRWMLEVTSPNILIDRLRLTGVNPSVSVAGTVFDRTFGNAFGTPGSFLGGDFVIEGAVGPWDLNVTYVDQVDSAADGAGAVKDIWGQLDLDFVGGATAPANFTINNRLLFHQDTDTVGPRLPCPPGVPVTAEGACVPEPSTVVYGLVIAGFVIGRATRRRVRG